MLSTFGSLLETNRRLFRAEIRASIAHCNGLFRAGVITRLESERLKNGLWTILKRADFDRNFFDNANSSDIFEFIETRLFQLVNEAADSLKIGRSRPHRAAAALRLWLREETESVVDALTALAEVLQTPRGGTVTDKVFQAFVHSFERDETRFREGARRTNQMPCPAFDSGDDEATAEIDFALVAHELGFEKVAESPLDSANDRDFCVEFASAAALAGLHLSNLANALLITLPLEAQNRRQLEIVRGRSVKFFGQQTALLSLLKGLSTEPTTELDEVCEMVFDVADTLKSCLQVATSAFKEIV